MAGSQRGAIKNGYLGKHEANNPPCFFDLQDMLAKMYFDEPGDVKAGLEHLEDVDPNAMMYVL